MLSRKNMCRNMCYRQSDDEAALIVRENRSITEMHGEVHQDDVRTKGPHLIHRLVAGRRFAYDIDVRLRLEERAEARAEHRVVVSDPDPGALTELAADRHAPADAPGPLPHAEKPEPPGSGLHFLEHEPLAIVYHLGDKPALLFEHSQRHARRLKEKWVTKSTPLLVPPEGQSAAPSVSTRGGSLQHLSHFRPPPPPQIQTR